MTKFVCHVKRLGFTMLLSVVVSLLRPFWSRRTFCQVEHRRWRAIALSGAPTLSSTGSLSVLHASRTLSHIAYGGVLLYRMELPASRYNICPCVSLLRSVELSYLAGDDRLTQVTSPVSQGCRLKNDEERRARQRWRPGANATGSKRRVRWD